MAVLERLGNQQLVWGGVVFTSARQLAISVSTSVSPVLSVAAASGGLAAKLRPSPKQRQFCQAVLLSYLRKEREEGSTPFSQLVIVRICHFALL